jgi:hypothetical protein
LTLAALQTILVGSELNLDPYPATYYLIQAILYNGAYLTEKMGLARAYGTDILLRAEMARGIASSKQPAPKAKVNSPTEPAKIESNISQKERVQLYNITDRAKERLNDVNYQLAQFNSAASQKMKGRLDEDIKRAESLINAAIQITQTEIVDAQFATLDVHEYVVKYTAAIDAVYALVDAGTATLNEQFDAQIQDARTTEYTTTLLLLLVFVIAAVIAFLISGSITGPVNHLVGLWISWPWVTARCAPICKH